MDARGLIAFIVTVHEAAILLGLLVAVILASLGVLVLRNTPPLRRFITIAAFSIGAALLTFAVTSRIFHVRALDVEVVRINE